MDRLKAADLEAGQLNASWKAESGHAAFQSEEFEAMAAFLMSGVLLGLSAGALNVSDEWNRLLPDYKFTSAEDFLAEAWSGKP